jgi:hypothetical protein
MTSTSLSEGRLPDGSACRHEGETGTYCTCCWANLYEARTNPDYVADVRERELCATHPRGGRRIKLRSDGTLRPGQRGWDQVLRMLGLLLLVVSAGALILGFGLDIYGRAEVSEGEAKFRELDARRAAVTKRAEDYNDQLAREMAKQKGLFAIPRMYVTLPQDEPELQQIEKERSTAGQQLRSGEELREKSGDPIWYGTRGSAIAIMLLIAAWYAPRPVVSIPEEATKKCPFCAERIKVEANACRFCGRDIVPDKERDG